MRREDERGARVRGAVAGMGAVVGWLLYDLATYLRFGPPLTFFELTPGCVVTVVLGAVLGACWASRRSALLWAGALGALSILPLLLPLPLSRAVLWIPRAAFLLLLAAQLSTATEERIGRGRRGRYTRILVLGVLLGIFACGLKSAYRHPLGALPMSLLLGASGALLLALATKLRLLGLGAFVGLGVPLVLLVSSSVERSRLQRPDLGPPPLRAAAGPNLVLIVLDTLRADRLAPYGYERVTTPALDRFVAERMTRYTNAHSVSPWTLPSHASLLTGLLPAEHGADHPRGSQEGDSSITLRPALPLAEGVETLAERLRDRGYRTGAFLANCAYLDDRFGLDQGFERYDARPPVLALQYLTLPQLGGGWPEVGHVPYRPAREITAEAERWLAGVDDRPFFLLLNFMEAHEPYVPPRELRAAFGDAAPIDPLKATELDWPVLYDRALLNLDEQLARFLRDLERDGRLENTALVITSDHGQALGEHGFSGHAWALTEEQIGVPLYVLPPGGRREVENGTPLDSASVHGLLLDLLGLPRNQAPRPFAGPVAELYRAEAPASIRAWAASVDRNLDADRLAWIDGARKWIACSDGTVRAFDLEIDPGEQRPLELSVAERAEALERARAWWAAHPPREAGPDALPDELLERMNALGYGGK